MVKLITTLQILLILLAFTIIVKSYINHHHHHPEPSFSDTKITLDTSKTAASSSTAVSLFSNKASSSSTTATPVLYTTPIQKLSKTPILKVIDPKSQTEIILIGVSHGSPYSAELVKNTIQEIQPACVILELCADRFISISLDSKLEPYSNQSWIDRYALNLKYRQEEALRTQAESNSNKNNKSIQSSSNNKITPFSSWWLGVNNTITRSKATAKFISSQGLLPGFVIVMSMLGSGTQLLTATFAASAGTSNTDVSPTNTNGRRGISNRGNGNNALSSFLTPLSKQQQSQPPPPQPQRYIEDEFTTAIRISQQLNNIPIRLADAAQNDTLGSLNTLISPALVNPKEMILGIKNMLFSFVGISLPDTLDTLISTAATSTTNSVGSTTSTNTNTKSNPTNTGKANNNNNNKKQNLLSLFSNPFKAFTTTAPSSSSVTTPLVSVETALSESQWVSIPRIYFDNPSLVKSILPLLILSAMLVVFDIVSAADCDNVVSTAAGGVISTASISVSNGVDGNTMISTTSSGISDVVSSATNTIKSVITSTSSSIGNSKEIINTNNNNIITTATSTLANPLSTNHDDESFSIPLANYLFAHHQFYFSQLVRQIGPGIEEFFGNFLHFLEFAVLVRLSKVIGTDRDKILTKNILNICQEKQFKGKQVVVVIGMLHSNGIAKYIMTGQDPFEVNDTDHDKVN